MAETTRDLLVGEEDRIRMDQYLSRQLPEYSRSRIQALIRDGFVCVDGEQIRKPALQLARGQKITMIIPESKPSPLEPEHIPLDIVYENKDLAIINKPAGMVVHPAPGHSHGTLVHAALSEIGDLAGIGGVERPGIVHRLDKDTSGLIVIAKNDPAHLWLQDQFKSRQVEKTYLALVDGTPKTPRGRVDAPIGRNHTHRKLMAVTSLEMGRTAISEYAVRETFPAHTLLEIHPLTGRTHQIRVHLAFIGCPIAGDKVYGKRTPTIALGRHFLHAWRLKITLPGENTPRTFITELPADLQRALASLRENAHSHNSNTIMDENENN